MFSYLIDKVRSAKFECSPFSHIHINNFLMDEHFSEITSSPEIHIGGLPSDESLFDRLISSGYKIIDFPGCVLDRREYLRWHRDKKITPKTDTACEGFGVTFRLMQATTPTIAALIDFIGGDEFQDVMTEKFGIDRAGVFYDCGLQKYLDGYEISPHPDIRRKALTYMVNINPDPLSELRDHHTRYLRFDRAHRYIQAYWEGNPGQDRCWVPWNWCEVQKVQAENNSIVIFAPSNDTLHAVKANYDHLAHQRTQLYGNFWFHQIETAGKPRWEDLDITATPRPVSEWRKVAGNVAGLVPRATGRLRRDQSTDVISNRLKHSSQK